MIILKANRKEGKTTELVKMAVRKNYAMVVTNKMWKKHIVDECKRNYSRVPDIYTIEEAILTKGKALYGYNGIVIDEVESVLSEVIKQPVKYITTSATITELIYKKHILYAKIAIVLGAIGIVTGIIGLIL